MLSDNYLLETFVRDRSRAAFEEILRRHGGLVFGVCRRSLGDLQEAEDAAQSVFLIFLEKAPRLGRGTVLSAWLYRTAVFVSRNQMRARIRRERLLPEPASPAAPPAWEEARPHLDDALAQLPQRLQDALVVHYFQGKSLAETAATLDCPVKTLEKRVNRGLERLRALLARAGVAIGSAALIALLQQEARAAASPRVAETLRSRPIPPPSAPSRLLLLRSFLFPASVALVTLGLLAGVLRLAGVDRRSADRAPGPAARAPGSTRSTATVNSGSGPGATAAPSSGTLRSFPATFEEFAALYRKLAELPEKVERWTALGIDIRQEDLSAIPNLDQYDLNYAGQLIFDLFKAWAARDPRLAAEWLYRAYALLPSADGWAPERPEDSGAQFVTMMEATLELWFARDAAAVEAWMKGLPAGVARDWTLAEYVLVAARRPGAPFESLAAQADTLGISQGRRAAVCRLAEEWARRDPKAATAWVLRLPASLPKPASEGPTFTLDQPRFEESLLLPLASQQEPPALEAAAFLGDVRRFALARIAISWADSDLDAARRWSESLPEAAERNYAMNYIGEAWAKSDAPAALEFARAHPGAEWRDTWLEFVALEMVAGDRSGAEAVVRLASPEQRPGILSQVLRKWGELHPREVGLDTLRTLFAEGASLQSYSGFVWDLTRTWASQDPRAAAAWAMGIDHASTRQLVLRAVGTAWAEQDPRAVIEWAAGVPEPVRDQVLVATATVLIGKDRDLALELASRLTVDAGKIQVLIEIGTAWARQAPDQALAWAKSLRLEDGRDFSIAAVLSGWAETDAEQARREVGSIVDEQSRSAALQGIEESRRQAERKALRKSLLRREEGE
jgi:RNA polymerase sigma factor (sigma-70 family)